MMEIMDTQHALEAVERLQAKLKERGETPTQEKLSLLKIVLQSPLFHHILSLQPTQQKPLMKAKAVSKSVSMNCGSCQGMLQGLSHSDSYTWAVENRRPSSGTSINREDSFSSLSSQDMSLTNLCTDYTHNESQYCTPPRICRTMSMGRNLSAIAHERRYIEMIELTNDGKGLGFGIVGGRSTGVMVKTILPGGAAGQDKRLRSGDQILRIGDTDLAGMNSEQVAQVLRNAGTRVKLLIARDITKDCRLSSPAISQDSLDGKVNNSNDDYEFSVDFTKNSRGLGFTISTYTGNLNSVYSAGVIVKSIVKDSAIDQNGRIRIGDIILSVDGVSLQGCSEQRAKEILRRTGPLVRLRLLRRALRLSPNLPLVRPLHPLRHSHSFSESSGHYGMGLKKIHETDVFPHALSRICSLRELSRHAAHTSRWLRHVSQNDMKLTATEEEDLRRRWQCAMGPRYEVTVCQLERFGETSGLGISLEARAGHHYVCSILPEGPVGQSGKIFTEDQILEVNGIPLIGETHKEVVNILKELPMNVCLVCSRILPPPIPDSDEEDEDTVRLTLKELLAEFNEKLDHGCVIPCPTAEDITKRGVPPMSPPLAMWEREAQVVELEKGEAGLGFSILDYQDPEDATRTVLVIRSLVPGGVADQDGRLLPGDRLVFVNDTDLEGSSLDYAVHVLKSTGYGPIRIGVAKPLPLELCGSLTPILERSTRASCDDTENCANIGLFDKTKEPNTNSNSNCSEENSTIHYTPMDNQLNQRFSITEGDGGQHTPPLPPRTRYERTVTVVRGNRSLGMSVSTIKDGSGMLVHSVVQGGCLSHDGRLGVGDAILAINGEPTSNLTNARARAMLRRHSVLGPEMRITYVPAHQVDEYRIRLCLPPLASMAGNSPLSSPTPPHHSPESVSALTTSLGPIRAESAPSGVSSNLKHSASVKFEDTASNPSTSRTSALFKASYKGPTFTPAPDSSWHIPESLLHKKEEVKEDAEIGQDKKNCSSADGKVPVLEVEKTADSKVEGEEELYPHLTVTWDPPRRVQLTKAPGESLGISIMGGRGMGRRLSSGKMIRGVFITHISPDSPAAQHGTLQMGDRILEVCGVDLQDASHEQAVETIRRAGDCLDFLVQSGQLHDSLSPVLTNHERLSPTLPPSSHSSKEAETLSGLLLSLSPTNPYTPTPFKVPSLTPDRMDQASPITATTQTRTAVEEEEDDDHSRNKMLQRYGSLSGKLHMIELEKDPTAHGLGISLSGNKDDSRARMGIYVAHIDPKGPASLDGRIMVGDELLEINGQILYGRSHQNATAIINNAPSKVKIIIIRNKTVPGQATQECQDEITDTINSQEESTVDGELCGDDQHIILPQDHKGLGLCLGGDESKEGVIVKALIQDGTANKDGRIKVGDRIVAVENQPVAGLSVDEVFSLILKHQVAVKLSISCSKSRTSFLPPPTSLSHPRSWSPNSSTLNTSFSSSSSFNNTQTCHMGGSDLLESALMTSDPLRCPILAGRECTIEICKGNLGLGLSIVGGCDTRLGAVIIHEVNDGGAAQRDGRLRAGDQILEVNEIDLRKATHDEAIGVLRLTTQRVCLHIFRHQEVYREEDLWDVFSLNLRPHPGEGLGLTTVGKCDDTGIFVSDIIRGSVTDLDGRLLLGDQILSINGEDVRAVAQEHAQRLLQNCSGEIYLEVARFKAGLQYSQQSQSEDSDCSTLTPSSGCDGFSGQQRETDGRTGNYSFQVNTDVRNLTIQKTGDRILKINDVPVEDMTAVQARGLLKKVTAASGGHCAQEHNDVHTRSAHQHSGLPHLHDSIRARVYKTVTLDRGSSGLGFSIIGGFGSPHGDLPIYIKTIFNKGAAIENGRLKRGDQIISVNGHCLEGVTHAEAVDILKKTKGTVILTVLS